MGGHGAQRKVCGHVTGFGYRTVLVREPTAVDIGGAEREGKISTRVIMRLVRPCPGESEVLVAIAAYAIGEGDVWRVVRLLLVVVVIMLVLVFVTDVGMGRSMGLFWDSDC